MFSRGDAYERFMGRWSRLLAPRMVAFVGLPDGGAVLDVGAGTGELSFALHRATTTTRITGVDPAEAYVKAAAERRGDEHDGRVRFAVGDAQDLHFDDAVFDATLSMLVLSFVPDRARAIQEMKRVTRHGGVLAAAVWDYGDGMQMLRAFWDEAVALDPAAALHDEAHLPLTKEGELAASWAEHGLRDVAASALVVPLHFESFDDFWAPFLLGQGPAGAHATALSEERRVALEQRLRARLLGDASVDRPFELTARAWAVKGVVP